MVGKSIIRRDIFEKNNLECLRILVISLQYASTCYPTKSSLYAHCKENNLVLFLAGKCTKNNTKIRKEIAK